MRTFCGLRFWPPESGLYAPNVFVLIAVDLSPIDVDLTRFGNTTTTESIIITAKLEETGG